MKDNERFKGLNNNKGRNIKVDHAGNKERLDSNLRDMLKDIGSYSKEILEELTTIRYTNTGLNSTLTFIKHHYWDILNLEPNVDKERLNKSKLAGIIKAYSPADSFKTRLMLIYHVYSMTGYIISSSSKTAESILEEVFNEI